MEQDIPPEDMDCPHCLRAINVMWNTLELDGLTTERWNAYYGECPSCNRMILRLVNLDVGDDWFSDGFLAYPVENIESAPKGTPVKYAKQYMRALEILYINPDASAALSRRCLQELLREEVKVTKGKLSEEIQQVVTSKDLPSYLEESLGYIRKVGNLGAHPEKDLHTDKIVSVEPNEAKWVLDTLHDLLDHYFTRKKIMEERKAGIDNKISNARRL